jgi:WhiB family redox-sensing transcriptional regulator
VRPTTLLEPPSIGAQRFTSAYEQDLDTLVADLVPCRSNDPELWFAERTADVERAKALCGTCPLATECLAGALERAEPWGVWGGQVFVGGVIVPTKRGRGRPRKDQARVA